MAEHFQGAHINDGKLNEEPVGEIPALSEPPRRRNVVFFGEAGGLRSGWRLLIYLAIVSVLAGAITLLLVRIFGQPRGVPPISAMILQELVGFAVVLAPQIVMSFVERRSLGDYGLPARGSASAANSGWGSCSDWRRSRC